MAQTQESVVPRKAVVDELRRLQKRSGRLLPEDVVRQAENPDNSLHPYFEWDDSLAAHQYRIAQAESLIRRVRIHLVRGEKQIVCPQYVSVAHTTNRCYMPIERLKSEQAEDLMRDEFRRMRGNILRASELTTANEDHLPAEFMPMLEDMATRVNAMLAMLGD